MTTTNTIDAKKLPKSEWGDIDISKVEKNAIDDWDVLDISAFKVVLPSAGWHTAKIAQVSVSSGAEALWLAINMRLPCGYMPPALVQPLATKQNSQHARRVADGHRLMFSTAKALGVELPAKLNPDALEELFEGKDIDVKLACKARDGIDEMIIRKTAPAGTGGK